MRVVVVGGGITGLAAAWELQRHPSRPEVTLIEASERLGGKIRTTPFAGLPAVDEGADAFLARVPWATELCVELGIDDLVAPATGRAYVWWNGRMHPIPEGLVLGVPKGLGGLARSGLMSWRGKARAALEPLVPRRPATDALGATIRYRFGAEVLERLVGPLVGGINAGDADRLSLAATTPQLAEAAHGSRSLLLALRRTPAAAPGPVFLAPKNGMQTMVDGLIDRLSDLDVRLEQPVTTVSRDGSRWRVDDLDADAVIVTAPAWAGARLLAETSPDATRLLAGIDHASVALVTLAFAERHVSRPLDGSGHLVPKAAQRHITACSWGSTKWAGWQREGQVILRASLGRDGDRHALESDDDDLVNLAVTDLSEQLGVCGDPLHQRVSRWERSFPQYRPGHIERVTTIVDALRRDADGVVATGAAFAGLGVPACIRQGRESARAVLARAGGAIDTHQDMQRTALAIACLVTLAGCGSGRANVAPATTAVTTTAATTTVVDSPSAGVSAPPTTEPSTTTAPTPSTVTTVATPAPAPAEGATEPLQAIGGITIARLGIDAKLYEGVTLPTLDHGPGHWPGTAMPGEPGNAVIAGHRVSHSRPFRYIDRLSSGDEVVFTVDGRRSVYVVTGHEIVTPDRVDIVNPTDTATATLFACEPPGSTRYRYVVYLALSASA